MFHAASWTGPHDDYKLNYETNVVGTQNVVEACIEQGVAQLIYTSSASVVADGNNIRVKICYLSLLLMFSDCVRIILIAL